MTGWLGINFSFGSKKSCDLVYRGQKFNVPIVLTLTRLAPLVAASNPDKIRSFVHFLEFSTSIKKEEISCQQLA